MLASPTHKELRAAWQAEYDRPFSGWDFSALAGRRIMLRPEDTWDYSAAINAAVSGARAMVDMDTGGGEFLAALPMRPPNTWATEGYLPNIERARERLEPLGVRVIAISDAAQLPFANAQFDLVTNRHGSYIPDEVRRVLALNGLFITQQVGDQTNRRLHELLGHPLPALTWNLDIATSALRDAGFSILEAREEFPITRYSDVGAIAYYLKAIPWEIPDFTVEKYFERLLALHRLIEVEGFVDIPFHQFFIRAHPRG